MSTAWHNLTTEKALASLQSTTLGLTEAEAQDRLQRYGPNELVARKRTSPILVFFQQFLSPLIYVLLAAVVVSILVGHLIDAWVILGILLINAIIGFTQETRAEKAMEAIMHMAAPRAKVRRDGRLKLLLAEEVVPSDIILLESGDRVPADARLIECSNLHVNESPLTGESIPVEKHAHALDEVVPVADRTNLVYMGTTVTSGRARGVVIATGMSTEVGKIAAGLQEVKTERTPIQKSISKISQYIIALVLGILLVLAVVSFLKGLGWTDFFFLAVAAAVSAIPEGLPAVVTVLLTIGMRVMAGRNAIIRKLVAVETLGSATVICSDKTGTLTLNQMMVKKLFVGGEWISVTGEGYEPVGQFHQDGRPVNPDANLPPALHLRIGVLCSDAVLTQENSLYSVLGDPTEGALIVAAAKMGLDKESLESRFPRLDEIPFESESQYMATLHPGEQGGKVAYVKGSPEKLLHWSRYVLKSDGVKPLQDEDARTFMQANEAMAGEALRVIATAYVEFTTDGEDLTEETLKEGLVFVGLSGMADPPREAAIQAVKLCKQAGIKVVMITGDHKITAESIAHQLDLAPGETLTGVELEHMNAEELTQRVEGVTVFARIEPLHKLKIVEAFRGRGHIVAMTGDGVNDAPALKAASIGIAMGITGTDVAKEASDMVLADDNFASIVGAVEEGRAIFNRLRNVIFFLLSTNLGELLALTLSVAIVGEAPLLAVQILWVNLVTDTAAAIPLGLEPKHGNELKQPPRHPRVGILFPGLLMRIFFMATLMGIGISLIFWWAEGRVDLQEAQTIAFCSMVAFEWFRAFNARSDEDTLLRLGVLSNRWLILAIGIAILLQISVIYLPFLQEAFRTVPLSLNQWGIALSAGAGLFLVEELRKVFLPKLFTIGKWVPLRVDSSVLLKPQD